MYATIFGPFVDHHLACQYMADDDLIKGRIMQHTCKVQLKWSYVLFDRANVQDDAKKQELLKNPTKIEEIQEKNN